MALRRVAGVAFVVLGLTGAAAAQSKPDQPLSGPKVDKERPAHLEDRFSEDPGKGDKRGPMADRGVPMQAYAQILDKLRGDAAPKGLQLSSEQDQKIQGIQDDFRRAMQAYIQKSRQDMGNQEPKPEAPKGKGAGRQLREELRKDAPKPKDWEVKIWAVLSEPQQNFVNAGVRTLREQMEQRRGEEYMKKQLEKRSGEAGKAAAGGDAPAAAKPVAGTPGPEARERARRVFERLQQLSPEQRLRILQKLEDELDREEAGAGQPAGGKGGKSGKRGARGGEDKPVPSIDTVRVPTPDKPSK